jgi:multiple sugar transport system substrate-binding protein
MNDFKRRDVLKAGAALTAAAAAGFQPFDAAAQQGAADLKIEPEKNAKLRVLRWKRFVQGDEDKWLEFSKKFADMHGIEVRVDSENWEDLRPKAAVAANVGSGPDIIIGTYDDPHKFPDKLVDLSDLGEYFDKKYGWYDVSKDYGMRNGKWIALPMGTSGNALVHRKSHIHAAGFDSVPKDTDGFLKLCQALKSKNTPAGFALGHATGDANVFCHWVIWSHGGKLVDDKNQVVIASKETIKGLEYGKALYETFVPGTLSWLDPNNNKAFLDGQCSLTANGISIYYAAKTSEDPAMKAMADDIDHANFPVGPVGRPTELNLMFQAFVFKYSKYPQAAKAYLQFMWEKDQYWPWQQASIGYVTHPLKAYEENPLWKSDPKNLPYRDAVKVMLPNGYSGQLGAASAAAMADFIMVDMVASVAAGQETPQVAAEKAAERAHRYYKG